VRRLLCRKWAISVATKATSRGPDCPVGTPGGNRPASHFLADCR
jgi:hypothetical protein